jgi:hypothetical protein
MHCTKFWIMFKMLLRLTNKLRLSNITLESNFNTNALGFRLVLRYSLSYYLNNKMRQCCHFFKKNACAVNQWLSTKRKDTFHLTMKEHTGGNSIFGT